MRCEARSRGFFHDFLVVPLQRALTVEKMDDIPAPVTKYLDLDVARRSDVALDKQAAVAEICLREPDGRFGRRNYLAFVGDNAYALAAAAGNRLENGGKTGLANQCQHGGRVISWVRGAGQHWNSGRCHQALRYALVAQPRDDVRVGPHKD